MAPEGCCLCQHRCSCPAVQVRRCLVVSTSGNNHTKGRAGEFKLWISAKRQELCFCETLYVWYKCWEIEACIHLKVVTDVLYSWQSGFVICKSSFPIFFYTWILIVAMYEKGARYRMDLFFFFSELTVWSQGAGLCSMSGVFWAGVFAFHKEIAEWLAKITW